MAGATATKARGARNGVDRLFLNFKGVSKPEPDTDNDEEGNECLCGVGKKVS